FIYFVHDEDCIRYIHVTVLQTCALPIYRLGLAEIHRSRPSPAVLTEPRQSRTIGIQHLANRWRLLAARINTQRKHHWAHRRTRAITLPTAGRAGISRS